MNYTIEERKAFVDSVEDILEKAGLWFHVYIEWRTLWLLGGILFDETCPAEKELADDKKKDWYESDRKHYSNDNKMVNITISEELDDVYLMLGNFCNVKWQSRLLYGKLSYKGDMPGALEKIREYVENYKKVNKEL